MWLAVEPLLCTWTKLGVRTQKGQNPTGLYGVNQPVIVPEGPSCSSHRQPVQKDTSPAHGDKELAGPQLTSPRKIL